MLAELSRRQFLQRSALAGAGLLAASPRAWGLGLGEIRPATVISGSPRERGRKYGSLFKDEIAAFLRRAGLLSPARYLERLAAMLERYLATPGRLVQPLDESSFDAWIKLYRPNAHAQNARISYYLKGAMVALLLWLTTRRLRRMDVV